MTKTCSKCELDLDIEQNFYRLKSGYLQPSCKECQKKYRAANRKAINQRRREHRAGNLAQAKAKAKLEREKYAEKIKQRQAEWRSKNRATARRLTSIWKAANPDKVRVHNVARRSRLAGAEGSHTVEEWQALCKQFNQKCAYCMRDCKPTVHHVVPLFVGGSNWISNILPACKNCNSRIGTKVVYPKDLKCTKSKA